MSFPKVSVLTTTYGHEAYILDTIKGVLSQKYDGKIEFIISNDNSRDGTDLLICDYLSKNVINENVHIKYFNHSQNKGMMKNFLWTLDQATGDYVAICEGDDYWIDDYKISRQVIFLEQHKEYSVCATNFNFVLNDKIIANKESIISTKSYSHLDLIKANRIATVTSLFRNNKEFLAEFYQFYKNSKIAIGDYMLWLFLTKKGSKVFHMTEVTSNYRILEESASHFKDEYKKIQFEWGIFKIQNYFISKIVDNEIKLKVLKSVVNSKVATFFHKYERVLARKQFRYLFTLLKKNNLPLTLKNKIRYHLIKFNI